MMYQNHQWFDLYLNNPHYWVEDVLSWDDSINLALSDQSIFTLLFSSVFTKSYISVDSFSKLSFLDTLMSNDGILALESQELYSAVFFDLFEPIKCVFYPFQFISRIIIYRIIESALNAIRTIFPFFIQSDKSDLNIF